MEYFHADYFHNFQENVFVEQKGIFLTNRGLETSVVSCPLNIYFLYSLLLYMASWSNPKQIIASFGQHKLKVGSAQP